MDRWMDIYQPAPSICLHIAVGLHRFGAVAVNKDCENAALLVSVLHDVKTVHGEGVECTD